MQRHHKKEYKNIMCERANKRLKRTMIVLHLQVFSKS